MTMSEPAISTQQRMKMSFAESTAASMSVRGTRSRSRTADRWPCPVAEWFTVSHAVSKSLLMLTSVAVIVIMFSWESQGLRVYDLDDSVIGINYRNYVYAYFGLAAFTIAYAVSMILLGCGGCAIPSIFQAIASGAFLFMWMVTSALISAALEDLFHNKFARMMDLNILVLRIANGIGFLVVGFYALDILLAFMALRKKDEEALAREISEIKSLPCVSSTLVAHKLSTGRGSYSYRRQMSK